MNVHLDGIVFSLQRQGGISVYFRQLMRFLETRSVTTTLTMDQSLLQPDIDHHVGAHIKIVPRPSRLLERYRDCRSFAGTSLFHSTYYRRNSDRRIPTVVTVHDFIYERYVTGVKRMVHVLQKHAAIRHADVVICISKSTRDDLHRYIGPLPGQQIEVIHNGAAECFKVLGGPPSSNRPFALFVGERRGYKNFRVAAQALTHVQDIELVCVGGGPLRGEEVSHLDAPTRRRIRHAGFVSDEQLNLLYNQAVCLVYPSSYEGFGIPVIEAMKAGCPVVCVEECAAVIEIGRDALITASTVSSEALAQAITQTCEGGLRRAVIARGLEVASTYSWSRTHQRTLDVYNRLSTRPRR